MARAKTDEQFKVISEQFEIVRSQISLLQKQSEALVANLQRRSGIDKEIDSAMEYFQRLRRVSESNCDFALFAQLFAATNARLFLRFKEVTPKKRTVIKIAGGELALGDKPAPVKLYEGPTGQRKLTLAASTIGGPSLIQSETDEQNGQEESSLRNVNRGERI